MEPRLARQATTLARAGYEVHVILWDRERLHPKEEDWHGVHVRRHHLAAPEGRADLALRLPLWWSHILRTVLALRPQIVHAIDLDSGPPSLLAARVLGVPFVYEIFDFYAEMVTAEIPRALRRSLARWERSLSARADLIVLPDLLRKAQLGGIEGKRLVEIMNVPEDRTVESEPPSQFVVFYGGMISKDRGLKDLVAACEAVGAKFVVAGHGPDAADLLQLVESSTACQYLGTIPYEEILRQTAASHVIPALYDPAVPNNRFAAPNKVYEAMMLRRPVVVSDGIVVADLVREVGCGLVVPYGDRTALTAALERLRLSPAEREAMGSKGRAAFEAHYNWDRMRDRLLDAYRDLLAAETGS